MFTETNRPEKVWVDKVTEFVGEFEKLCKAEGIQVYPTMSENTAAFSERTIRSLKNFFPLPRGLWIYVHSQIVSVRHSPEFQKNLIDRLDSKENQEIRHFVHSVGQTNARI